jgi:hypothetical protein
LLTFENAQMRYEPYPLAIVRPAMEASLYSELVDNFPDIALFGKLHKHDYKNSLSEKFNPKQYHEFLKTNRPWREFYAWVKSDEFITAILSFLKSRNIDIGVDACFAPLRERIEANIKRIGQGYWPRPRPQLRPRFEFSVLKADGGEVAPHTDAPKKIVTLVVTMLKEGEWDPSFGGGLDINRTNDDAYKFNWQNRMVPWDKVEVVESVPFVPNQCMIFIKTFNSLHSVRRMTQTGSKALRRSLTIVIDKDG